MLISPTATALPFSVTARDLMACVYSSNIEALFGGALRCPGVHGEAAAKNEAVGVGCEGGIPIHKDGKFTKIDSPDDCGRIGNQAGSDTSPVLLGHYKTDPEAELERPTRACLIDTEKKKLRLVELGTSYSLRSPARGPHGEAWVLGTDGAIHVIGPNTGTLRSRRLRRRPEDDRDDLSDRVIATYAVQRVPWSWERRTRPDRHPVGAPDIGPTDSVRIEIFGGCLPGTLPSRASHFRG